MQNFKTLRQPLLGELAMSRRERERRKNAIYSGHLRLCQQPRAAHALRSDQQNMAQNTGYMIYLIIENLWFDELNFYNTNGFVNGPLAPGRTSH
jgi:hypothetical protein